MAGLGDLNMALIAKSSLFLCLVYLISCFFNQFIDFACVLSLDWWNVVFFLPSVCYYVTTLLIKSFKFSGIDSSLD